MIKNEMNGYSFRNLLKITRRRFALSAGEQALYTELVDICNMENWSTSFQVSNGELTTALMCTEKTLAQWRQSLVNAGLINYSSGKSKRKFGTYTMVVNFTTIPTTHSTTYPTTYPTTNPSDYIKLNKTKQNNIPPLSPEGECQHPGFAEEHGAIKGSTASTHPNLNAEIKNKNKTAAAKIDTAEVQEVYNTYPTRCPIQHRSLGKSERDKVKIQKLLGERTKDELIDTIKKYITDCINSKTYVKNFATFLNNLPDFKATESSEVKLSDIPKTLDDILEMRRKARIV